MVNKWIKSGKKCRIVEQSVKNKLLTLTKKFISDIGSTSTKKEFFKLVDEYNQNSFLPTKTDMELISKEITKDVFRVHTQNKETDDNRWVKLVYPEEIQKLQVIMSSDELINKINGSRVLLYGDTGTGKTRLVNYISSRFPKYKLISREFATLISSKMGQTQINLINLANEVNNLNSGKTILFMDEIDSIISNRSNSDLGEQSRITATFLQFLDMLNKNVFFFAATNVADKLDSAVLRRFNIKIKTHNVGLEEVIDILHSEGFDISQRRKQSIEKLISKREFSLSDINDIANKQNVDDYMGKNFETWEEIVLTFDDCLNEEIDVKELTVREQRIYKIIKGEKDEVL